jgi:dTDP-4-dehydrorhamnose 3,5-epimerase
MKIEPTGLAGLLLIDLVCHRDERGSFAETYQRERYLTAGIADDFVQDNHSRSVRNVLRGLHFQIKRPQAQIVTVMRGRIFDVTVDLRPGSATFGRWFGAELADEGPQQIYMAPGFAHGFCVLSDVADMHYKVSRIYDRHDDGGLLWNDADLGIAWPVTAPNVLPRDAANPRLRDLTRDGLPHLPPVEK